MAPAATPRPVGPFSCPRCFAQAPAAPTPQICGACRTRFVLRAGTRVDPAVTPPPVDRTLPSIKMRSAGTLTVQSAIVAPDGVLEGTLDPVTGLIPLDQVGIPYGDVVSIAVWRTFDILRLALVTLLALPLTLGLLAATVSIPMLAIFSLPILAMTCTSYYHLLVVRRNFARITSSLRTMTLRFDTPMRRRRRFHAELMRRAGLVESAIP